mgnify:CR=1 FL=1
MNSFDKIKGRNIVVDTNVVILYSKEGFKKLSKSFLDKLIRNGLVDYEEDRSETKRYVYRLARDLQLTVTATGVSVDWSRLTPDYIILIINNIYNKTITANTCFEGLNNNSIYNELVKTDDEENLKKLLQISVSGVSLDEKQENGHEVNLEASRG